MCSAACEVSSARWESPPEPSTIFFSCRYVSDYSLSTRMQRGHSAEVNRPPSGLSDWRTAFRLTSSFSKWRRDGANEDDLPQAFDPCLRPLFSGHFVVILFLFVSIWVGPRRYGLRTQVRHERGIAMTKKYACARIFLWIPVLATTACVQVYSASLTGVVNDPSV